jgi:hypothetical protein
MRKWIICVAALIIFINRTLWAQGVTKVGTTAAGFLNIDVGAKAVSMGGAFVSMADDITAMYWNSAGIARFSQSQAMFSYAKWIADLSFNYTAITFPLGNLGTIGANATFLTIPDMERTTILEPDGTGELFSAGSYALGLCYARNLTDRFSVGFNMKYVTEQIYHCQAHGVALDVGTLFTTQFYGLAIGMNISNFGTKMRLTGRDMLTQTDIDPQISGNNANINAYLETDRNDMPLMFRVGISMDVLKGMGHSNLILAMDALHPSDDVESINVGSEYVFNEMYALRAGYKSLFAKDSNEGPSFGAGVKYRLMGQTAIILDYAYLDFGVFNNVQTFSLRLVF